MQAIHIVAKSLARHLVIFSLLFIGAITSAAATDPVVRVAVLKFGTVAWELDVIRHHQLDAAEGFRLEITPLAGKQAAMVMLQAGEAHAAVSDWLWVSRQRNAGQDFTFAPYSTAVGALIVPAASPVQSLADLAGQRIGVAGGPLDKSWLLVRALGSERHGINLADAAEPVFAAPPLLSQKIAADEIEALLTFWPYAARLEAAGLRRLIGVDEARADLGVGTPVPMLGYVFSDAWVAENRDAAYGFLRASRKAKAILAQSDAEWERIRPLLRANDDATADALRDGFRAGIPGPTRPDEIAAAETLFAILAELGGKALVGPEPTLAKGTFMAGAGG